MSPTAKDLFDCTRPDALRTAAWANRLAAEGRHHRRHSANPGEVSAESAD